MATKHFTLRFDGEDDEETHRRLAAAAKRSGRSLTKQIIWYCNQQLELEGIDLPGILAGEGDPDVREGLEP